MQPGREERMRRMGLATCELPREPQCAPEATADTPQTDDQPKETDLNKVAELLRTYMLHWTLTFKDIPQSGSEALIEDAEARQLFEKFYGWWKRDTLMSSNLTVILTHPAYLKIIALGKRMLPFIFQSLADGTGPWFVALEAIVIDDPPIYPEHARDGSLMREDWLRWAKAHGYLGSEKLSISRESERRSA